MLVRNIKHILFHCGGLNKHDDLLLIFDRNSKSLANLFVEFSKDVAKKINKYEIKKQNNHGDKISKELEGLMIKASLIICMTKFSLAHSKARTKASKKGARFCHVFRWMFGGKFRWRKRRKGMRGGDGGGEWGEGKLEHTSNTHRL